MKKTTNKNTASSTRSQFAKSTQADIEAHVFKPDPRAVLLPIDLIEPTPDQPRTKFDEQELADLAASLRTDEVMQPVAVHCLPGSIDENGNLLPGKKVRIIAGERRWRAAQLAGLKHVPARLFDVSPEQVRVLALKENLLRKDLTPMEEARAFFKIKTENNLSFRGLAKFVYEKEGLKKLGFVQDRLDLLKLGEDVQALIEARPDTTRAAELINKVEDNELRAELIEQSKNGVSHTVIADEVRKYLGDRDPDVVKHERQYQKEASEAHGQSYGTPPRKGTVVLPKFNLRDALVSSVTRNDEILGQIKTATVHSSQKKELLEHAEKLGLIAEEMKRVLEPRKKGD